MTHWDIAPKSRYLGSEVPKEDFIWQDPVPQANYPQINQDQISALKIELLESGLQVSQLVKTAWASASTYRNSDKRGGANGARISLSPQNNWTVNNPSELERVLNIYKNIQNSFNQNNENQVSLTDLIVLGGSDSIELACKNAGCSVIVPFLPGRTDATQQQTDGASFDVLQPKVDGFRNYRKQKYQVKEAHLLVDKAQLLDLSTPEMTVLIGGMQVLRCNYNNRELGILTTKKDTLSQDYFVNLLDMNYMWQPADEQAREYVAIDRKKRSPSKRVGLTWPLDRIRNYALFAKFMRVMMPK